MAPVKMQALLPEDSVTHLTDGHNHGTMSPCGGSSVGRASAFQADCRGFESRPPLHGPVAQWITSSRFLPCRSQVRILPGSPTSLLKNQGDAMTTAAIMVSFACMVFYFMFRARFAQEE